MRSYDALSKGLAALLRETQIRNSALKHNIKSAAQSFTPPQWETFTPPLTCQTVQDDGKTRRWTELCRCGICDNIQRVPKAKSDLFAPRSACRLTSGVILCKVIRSFVDKETKRLFETGRNRKFSSVARAAIRKLTQIDIVERLEDLRIPPGNHLEALSGDRRGQHSIRINDQFRICFRWETDGAYDVEIVDYH